MTPPPVGSATPGEEAWIALAQELAPAKSLQRLDAATARVVSTVSIVATLLTGLGLVAAGLVNLSDFARTLAVVTVVLAFLAVLLALAAQIVTVTRVNANDLLDVRRWYRRRVRWRGPLARWATVVLVGAAFCAGWAAVLTLLAGPQPPTLAVTRTAGTVTVDVTFRGLDAGQVATATVKVDNALVASTAFGPGADGTATRTIAAEQVPTTGVVMVEAQGRGARCTATLEPGTAAEVRCPSG